MVGSANRTAPAPIRTALRTTGARCHALGVLVCCLLNQPQVVSGKYYPDKWCVELCSVSCETLEQCSIVCDDEQDSCECTCPLKNWVVLAIVISVVLFLSSVTACWFICCRKQRSFRAAETEMFSDSLMTNTLQHNKLSTDAYKTFA